MQKLSGGIEMSLFEKAKDLYWALPGISTEQKEKIFYFLKGRVKGEYKGTENIAVYHEYVKKIIETQWLNNTFSIKHPRQFLINRTKEDPKLLAYYLPQYHPDPHNDAWWGKGSTEWTNVSKSVPQYVGQYQPRLPGELGFYDLRLSENIHRQIELAKFYGVYGFSFYYYWFNGVRLLDLPFNKFVNDKSIDFPFNICWVNESWTKQWEGASNVPLIEQDNTVESYQRFITSCVNLFTKDNYIKVAGKPVLSVYRPLNVPKSQEVISHWRDYVRKETGLDLYIIGCIRTDSSEDYYADYKDMGFDACSEFAPGPQLPYMKDITSNKQFVCDKFFGKVYDYKDFVENKGYFQLKRDGLYRAVSPMWDNTARKKNKGLILDGATPELYKQWLIDIINETKKNDTIDDDIIFINAWNEWAEGTYLEPDLKWKYGYLEATKDAILACRDSGKPEMLGDKKLMIDEKKDWSHHS